jgi:Ca-activated chloride channel homolog
MNLSFFFEPPLIALAARREPQLCYVLLTVASAGPAVAGRPIHWALVADASPSMRIPILDEERFRALVRESGAQEVLVDGVPVWQLDRPLPPDIRAAAPGALDHVARALHSVVEQLVDADRFALVACAEEALTLVPGTSGAQRAALVAGIKQLATLNLGEQTELERGLRLGLRELALGRGRAGRPTERLLLLTDGFTQSPDECLALARQAAQEGVAMSTIGLGSDFHTNLLTRIADVSGGRALFLRHAEEVPRAIARELELARDVVARGVRVGLRLSQGVTLRRATRINPWLATLPVAQHAQQEDTVLLGDLEQGRPVRVLFELVVPPVAGGNQSVLRLRRLARVTLSCKTPGITFHTPTAEYAGHDGTYDLVAAYGNEPEPMTPALVDACARANAVHLQQEALAAAAQGDHTRAAALLRRVAARMGELGAPDLAAAVLREAAAVEHTGQTSRLGEKELIYATRRLGEG